MQPWTFIHVADIHIGSPRSFRFEVRFNDNWQTARKQIPTYQPDLLLVGGDLTRDGFIHDYEMDDAKAELENLGIPYHAIPGNMEGGNKWTPVRGPRDDHDDPADNVRSEWLDRYKKWFGPIQWTFVHKNVRFSGFYETVAGSSLPEEKEMWAWLEGLASLPRARHHVIITHSPLFLDHPGEKNFDIQKPEEYGPWYAAIAEPHRSRMIRAFQAAGVNIAVSGHLHHQRTTFHDGIAYIKAPATARPQWNGYFKNTNPGTGFLRFEVFDDAITHSFVALTEVSTRKGYGPVGHPLPHQRDYSLAWEK